MMVFMVLTSDTEVEKTLVLSPEQVREKLEAGRAKKLSKESFPYHNWKEHVLTVYRNVKILGEKANFPKKEVQLLQIAALFHDISLPEKKQGHEEVAAQIAKKELLRWGFSKDDIERIEELIRGTCGEFKNGVFMYKESEDIGINIIRDADQEIVNSPKFLEKSEFLRKEVGFQNKLEWIKGQVMYLSKIEFKTSVARKLWNEQKKVNLMNCKKKFKELNK